MSLALEKYKVLRALSLYGRPYLFSGCGKNQFGEPEGLDNFVSIKGLYHEVQGYVTSVATNGSNIKTKPNSMILCLKEEAHGVKAGMVTRIGGKSYRVIDLRDIENMDIFYDISLEVFLDE